MAKIIILVAGLCAAALLAGYLLLHTDRIAVVDDPREVGLSNAQRDLAAGRLRVKTGRGPPPTPWIIEYDQEYERILKQRYGIELDYAFGCVLTDRLSAEINAYNEPMLREIDRRFGTDVLEKARLEAYAILIIRRAFAAFAAFR